MIRKRLILLARLIETLFITIGAYCAYARSFTRGPHHILHAWPEGPVELGADVALFIHFDRRGGVAEHVRLYVRALRDNGFSVVFVTNSGQCEAEGASWLRETCHAVVVRRNVGYDFGAIREALDRFGLPRGGTRRLLIANDSVYGPLAPLSEMLARVDFEEADFWSATDSWQHRYHLQSYFLLAGRRALTDPAWRSFWRGVRQVSSRAWVVARYEVGLTQALLRGGLRCKAVWSYQDMLDRAILGPPMRKTVAKIKDPLERGRALAIERIRAAAASRTPLNATADLWRHLLRDGFPFLKIELLRDNPAGVPDIAEWRDVVTSLPHAGEMRAGEMRREGTQGNMAYSGLTNAFEAHASVAMIERHLQQKMHGRSP